MTCEKCKNRKATLFYADEGGGRHALCPSCGASQGKLTSYATSEEEKNERSPYIPLPTLTDLTETSPSPLFVAAEEDTTCHKCKTSLKELNDCGRVACPECYAVFADALLPVFGYSDTSQGRMPASRRKMIERQKSLGELKAQIKRAVENENYELAATLRDKIKKLENAI